MANPTVSVSGESHRPRIMFRGPSTTPAKPGANFVPPPLGFLRDTWRIIHSTLPMWKSSRNVTITYTALDSPPGAIDDLVQYQSLKSDKQKKVHGVDTPDPTIPAKFTWRGKGLLKITSSEWEVIGWGQEGGGWLVTYFAKTPFTPAGIDVYARGKDGISADLLVMIQAEMKTVEDRDFCHMVDEMFEVQHD